MTPGAQYTRRHRWRKFFRAVIKACAWDDIVVRALATELNLAGLIDELWKTDEFEFIYIDEVNTLHAFMQRDIFGVNFGMYLHFELGMTLHKINQLALVTHKYFDASRNAYITRHVEGGVRHFIGVPRITPARSELEPEIAARKEATGMQMSETGRVTLRPLLPVIGAMVAEESGRGMFPTMAEIDSGTKVDLIMELDATGFGALQISSLCIGSPHLSESASKLRIMATGNCGDGRAGAMALMDENVAAFTAMLRTRGEVPTLLPMPNGESKPVNCNLVVGTDLSCIRHCERMTNSGICCCGPATLRTNYTSRKPTNIDELMRLQRTCVRPTLKHRRVLGHRLYEGQVVPCPCCDYGKSGNPPAEYAALQALEKKLRADVTKPGVARFDKWRLDHARSHLNVQPGEAGEETLAVDMDQFYPCMLHGKHLMLAVLLDFLGRGYI